MDTGPILEFLGYCIYVAMAAAAIYGAFCVVLLIRRIAQKRFNSEAAADEFLDQVREGIEKRDFDGTSELCDSPAYWSKAVSQLTMVAIVNRETPIRKLRQLLAERFERDILADFEYRVSWVNTIVKAAPMLGLLGTVVGMINAFANIAAAEAVGTDPKMLADDISFALNTTAIGLTIAIPLVLGGALVNVRIGKLQDQVQEHLGLILEGLEDPTQDEQGGTAA